MKSWRNTVSAPSPIRGVTPTCVVSGRTLVATVVSVARAPTEADVEAARKEGYERGRTEAERELGEQMVKLRTEVNQLASGVVESMRKALPQIVVESEKHLVGLAFDIAQKLVADIPLTAGMVEAAVREALAEVEGATEVHVRIHPDDLEQLKTAASSVFTPTASGAQLRFHPAPEVSRGGCMVQTRFGVIDGRRETRAELVRQTLTE